MKKIRLIFFDRGIIMKLNKKPGISQIDDIHVGFYEFLFSGYGNLKSQNSHTEVFSIK